MTARDPFDFGRSSSPSGYGTPSPSGSPGGYGSTGYGGTPSTPRPPVEQTQQTRQRQAQGPTGPDSPVADDLVGHPPLGWLVVALVLGVLAAVVAGLLGEDVTVAAAAWFTAGPVGIALVAVYSRQDTAARARPIYDAPVVLGLLRWATGIALAAGILAGALRIAEWAGRL